MENQAAFRVLLLADTHIGFDFPLKPRVERRHRGPDFLANFRLALQPALQQQVDAVVHGGDLFDRSHIPDPLIQIALEPLVEVAQTGIPVFLVPGNHERAKIPLQVWRSHPNLHIFDQAGCIILNKGNLRFCVAGFPFTRKIQGQFMQQVNSTGILQTPADIRILCMHQTVEGAQVGPSDYTFRRGDDIIPGSQIPGGLAAILSGHIHRNQILRLDLSGKVLRAPVIYPGSVERTAFAEKNEIKGYRILEFMHDEHSGGCLSKIQFCPLPARPMVVLQIDVKHITAKGLQETLRRQFSRLDANSIVSLHLHGECSDDARQVLSAASLRNLAPDTMNVEIPFTRTKRYADNKTPADILDNLRV